MGKADLEIKNAGPAILLGLDTAAETALVKQDDKLLVASRHFGWLPAEGVLPTDGSRIVINRQRALSQKHGIQPTPEGFQTKFDVGVDLMSKKAGDRLPQCMLDVIAAIAESKKAATPGRTASEETVEMRQG